MGVAGIKDPGTFRCAAEWLKKHLQVYCKAEDDTAKTLDAIGKFNIVYLCYEYSTTLRRYVWKMFFNYAR